MRLDASGARYDEVQRLVLWNLAPWMDWVETVWTQALYCKRWDLYTGMLILGSSDGLDDYGTMQYGILDARIRR